MLHSRVRSGRAALERLVGLIKSEVVSESETR